jgi:diguanylate cyclase (GGDEF)-like protein
MFEMPEEKPLATMRRVTQVLRRARVAFAGAAENAAMAVLRREIADKDRLIAAQASALAHSAKIFNRASQAARIGVWQCSLPDETLVWTDVVYDIFDMPQGETPNRAEIVTCYTPASATELEQRRSQAIATRSGFSMDAEIVTRKGNHRWMRITASVECEGDVPVRIFGIKQDITEAKLLLDRTRYLAEFDLMTGLANRAQFQSRLAAFSTAHAQPGSGAALMLIDLDGFKAVNDTFGHSTGDECLRQAADRLRSVCADKADLIARVGGDEFAVLLHPMAGREALASLARDIVSMMGRPIRLGEISLQIGASVGMAFAAGLSPSELFQHADTALYAAKNGGRNTFRLFEHEIENPLQRSPRSAA